MNEVISQLSPRQAAKWAGLGYVAIFVLAILANFIVLESLVEPGDAMLTTANITESQGLFRVGLIAFLGVFVLDVAIAWLLHVAFRGGGRDFSLLTAWFRLVYTVFLGVGLIFFLLVLQLIGGADYLSAFGADQIEAQVLIYLDAFNYTWLIGLVAFGFHLLCLGYLLLKTGNAPRLLAILLMVAGVGYMIDTVAVSALAKYVDFETVFLVIVAVPSVVAEGWLMIWLMLRANRRAMSPAQASGLVES